MRVEGVGDGEPMTTRKLQQAESPVASLSYSVSPDSACSALIVIFSYFGVELTLYDKEVFSWSFLDNAFYLFVEFFDLLIFMVLCWCVDLDDRNILRLG